MLPPNALGQGASPRRDDAGNPIDGAYKNMPDDNNLPSGGTVEQDESDLMGSIADILDDPETDNDENEATQAAKPSEGDSDADDGSPSEADDDDEGDAEASDDEESDEEDDGPGDYAGGRFAADNAKVRLPDGSTTTIATLKSDFMRQSDYTRKTMELAERRKAFEQDQNRVSQLTQQLDKQLQFATHWLDLTRPVRPSVGYNEDPIAHGEYQDALQRWNEAAQYIGHQIQQAHSATEQQSRQSLEERRKAEGEAFLNALPALRDPSTRSAFFNEAVKVASEYGIQPQELDQVYDHRQWLVLKDAMAYRRLKARTSKAKQQIEDKPPMLRSRKRPTPKQAQNRARQARTERLSQEGTVDAGVAALMDMDL